MTTLWGLDADPTAQGRIKGGKPVAVLDIGSNSVRLVVYERLARALTPLYNEKASCSLGRGVAQTGLIAYDNIDRALTAIQRFALVSELMQVGETHVLATSAVREAANAAGFVSAVETTMKAPVRVLSGAEEAHFAALGALSGMPGFSGVVGDLGGGSLELSAMARGAEAPGGETHELGVIRLQDDSGGSAEQAQAIVRARLKTSAAVKAGGTFCAIGGTWRSLAKIHQVLSNYPLHMIQHYRVRAADIMTLCTEIIEGSKGGPKAYPGASEVSSSRRDQIPYGAAVLVEVLKAGAFEDVVFSALGVREGYLYGLLDPAEQDLDPLMEAAEEMNLLRARAPDHARDLIGFTKGLLDTLGLAETPEETRLREAACLLSDIGWRGHPDYRGEQAVDLVAYGSLTGVDHPGRAFLAEVLAVRYMGIKQKSQNQAVLALSSPALSQRAKLIGAAYRVAYPMSAAMPGILPRIRFSADKGRLQLHLPLDLAFLDGEHLSGRLDQLGTVAGIKATDVRAD